MLEYNQLGTQIQKIQLIYQNRYPNNIVTT